jgi:hypothetical protein
MKIPKGWNEVTIRQIILASDIDTDEEMNDIEKMAMTVSAMCDVPLIEINTMPLNKVREIMGKMAFLKEQPKTDFVNDFTIDNIKYIVNPGISQITGEQFQAFEYFTKDKDLITHNLHNLMAIICLKEGDKYVMSSAPERAQLFYERMTFDVVAPVSFFFFQLLTLSLKDIRHSLELKIDKTIAENQKLIKELEAEV